MFLWVIRLIIAFLIWRGLSRFLGGVQRGLQPGPRDNRQRGGQTPPVALARDPICGTYVVPSPALTTGSGSDARFFCSENCRRAYVGGRAS
jgi:hypothetical protein